MRKRSQLKWAVIGAALAALLMFGMEMTSGGINQVYGPLESSQPAEVGRFAEASKAKEQLQAAQRYEADLLKLQKKYGIQPAAASGVSEDSFAGDQESAYTSGAGGTPAYGADTNTDGSYAVRLPGIGAPGSDTGVNRLADGTAGMLQTVSSSGIRFIVTLFDSMTR